MALERGPHDGPEGAADAPEPSRRGLQLLRQIGRVRPRLRQPRQHWRSTFGPLARPLLGEDRGDRYRGARTGAGYALTLEHPHLFAWVAADLGAGTFRDLRIRTSFVPADGSPSSYAAGLLLRYIDDRHFYYCLLSGDGRVRLDVVFNGTPRVLLDWTGVAGLQEAQTSSDIDTPPGAPAHILEVVAADTRFTIAVDDEWVASCNDDTLAAGGAGVAAQSYERADAATFRFRELEVEARPLEVDRWRLRWERAWPKRRDQRWLLAQSLFGSGRYGEAAAEMARLRDGATLTGEQALALARALSASGHVAEAEQELRCVADAKEPGLAAEARYELATLFYARNEYAAARDELRPLIHPAAEPPAEALNVYGNVLFSLGDFFGAACAYLRAVDRHPAFPLFHRNAARALQEDGRIGEAVASYGEAGRLLLRQEALQELDFVVDALDRIATGAGTAERNGSEAQKAATLARALGGGRAFVEGHYAEAERAFGGLVANPSTDDAVITHLYGLCLLRRGDAIEALRHLQDAVDQEPENIVFRLRLAQTRFRCGELTADELLRLADLAADDPHVLHLQAVVALDRGDAAAAVSLLERARTQGDAATDVAIAIDYAEALAAVGRLEEALAAIELSGTAGAGLPGILRGGAATTGRRATLSAPAQLAQQKARLLGGAGRLDESADAWERAVALAPGDGDVVAGALAAAIAADRIMLGEGLLSRLFDLRPDASTHNLAGNLAGLKGEYRRAEAAYREALDLVEATAGTDESGSESLESDLRYNLVVLLLQTENYPSARAELDILVEADGARPRTAALLARVRRRYERRIECSSCAWEWWVPQQLPPQPTLRLRGEPPQAAPGGRCPGCSRVYCIGCAQHHLRSARFVCVRCDILLSIADEDIRFALRREIAAEDGATDGPNAVACEDPPDSGEHSVSAVG